MLESKALSVWSLAALQSAWTTQVDIMSETEKEKEKQERVIWDHHLKQVASHAGSEMFSSLFVNDWRSNLFIP